MKGVSSEVANHANFSKIRYAQCWEDADILIPALDIKNDATVLSIASAGDNSFALLAKDPAKVIAIDLSPAQIACVKIRIAMYKFLSYQEFLELMGSIKSSRRSELYQKIRKNLDEETRMFWDALPEEIENGIGGAGKFEKYFNLFRLKILPLIHSKKTIKSIVQSKPKEEREKFYKKTWNNWRWQFMFKIFFSKKLMGKLGRDPYFFNYVEGSVAEKILKRAQYAMIDLDTSTNPYLYWILIGRHDNVLPFALREENFNIIRERVDRLEIREQSIEDFLLQAEKDSIDAFNLSDMFEYMSEENTEKILDLITQVGRNKARIAYWNMLVPRKRPESLSDKIKCLDDIAKDLYSKDKAFFYSNFIVEEVNNS